MRFSRVAAALVFLFCIMFSQPARAGDTLVVPDASSILYAIGPENAVYLRNLNEIDPTWLGCCNSYTIDLSTDVGKAQFSALLSASLAHAPISIYVTSKTTAGPVIQVGHF